MSKNNKIIAWICGAVIVVVAIVAIVAAVVNNNNNQNANNSGNSTSETTTPTENQTDSIVGVWKYYDPEISSPSSIDFIYTFNADGTGTYTMSTSVMPFTYETNGNTLTITYEGSGTFETEYELNGDILNVKDSSNADTLYKKAN